MGFTPGPWRLAEAVQNKFSTTSMRRVRAAAEGLEHGAICEVYGVRDGSVAAANSHLITSAPRMYDALTVVRMSAAWNVLSAESQQLVIDALAQADGPQP